MGFAVAQQIRACNSGAIAATVAAVVLVALLLCSHFRTEVSIGSYTIKVAMGGGLASSNHLATSIFHGSAVHPAANMADGPPPCEASGYCSVGKVKTWQGNVATNEALREMLQAVAYKKEVIYTSGSHGSLELALNFVRSAQALGLAHVFIFAQDSQMCAKVPAAFQATTSCVWDSRPIPKPVSINPAYDMQLRRWPLIARMVRMGYNVLSVDTDVVLLDDPYRYFKSPPFSNFTVMWQDDTPGANCGVVYVQGASPSGPAAWMFVELVDRTMRQRENPEFMQSVYNNHWDMIQTAEQVMLHEVISSLQAGRPVALGQRDAMEEAVKQDMFRYDYHHAYKAEEMQWPADWFPRAGANRGVLPTLRDLKLPRPDNATWWSQNSKHFYPPKRGPVSAEWLEHPWEHPPDGLKTEHLASFPLWMVATYIVRGRTGFWGLDPPAQVIAHDVWGPSPPGPPLWKAYAFKGNGLWHWEVSEAFTGNNVLGLPQPKLLMLAPGVQLRTQTEEEFRQEVGKLARLAEALGRHLVMPLVPCDSAWLPVWDNAARAETSLPIFQDVYEPLLALQFPDKAGWAGGGQRTYCEYMRGLSLECLAVLPAHTDVLAFLARLEDRQHATPTRTNMLWHERWQQEQRADGSHGQPAAVELESVDAAVVAAADKAAAPVLFLGALPKVTNEASLPSLPEAVQKCWLYAPGAQPLEPLQGDGMKNRRERQRGAANAGKKP